MRRSTSEKGVTEWKTTSKSELNMRRCWRAVTAARLTIQSWWCTGSCSGCRCRWSWWAARLCRWFLLLCPHAASVSLQSPSSSFWIPWRAHKGSTKVRSFAGIQRRLYIFLWQREQFQNSFKTTRAQLTTLNLIQCINQTICLVSMQWRSWPATVQFPDKAIVTIQEN